MTRIMYNVTWHMHAVTPGAGDLGIACASSGAGRTAHVPMGACMLLADDRPAWRLCCCVSSFGSSYPPAGAV